MFDSVLQVEVEQRSTTGEVEQEEQGEVELVKSNKERKKGTHLDLIRLRQTQTFRRRRSTNQMKKKGRRPEEEIRLQQVDLGFGFIFTN